MTSSLEAELAKLVEYHRERTTGRQYHGTGEDFSFFSAKSERVLKSALGRRYIEQNNFSYGNFNRIRSEPIVRGMEETLAAAVSVYPDELRNAQYFEGAGQTTIVNRYARSGEARAACLKYFGTRCFICGLDLMTRYGKLRKI